MKFNALFAAFALLACVSCGTSYNARTLDGDEYVDVGYGKIKKSENTMSVAKLNAKKDVENSAYSNIYEYLQGRVAGVEVNGNSIRIRGDRSIMASNEPLIIVDGMEMNDISDINPQMVSSIEVLKDGASTAIYGSRGANGVILIKLRQE